MLLNIYLKCLRNKARDNYYTINSTALVQHKCNSTTYGSNSLNCEGGRMWNKLNFVF